MKFEIVDFYPSPIYSGKETLCGDLHVYLIDHDIDIRCIKGLIKLDHKTKKKVYYVYLPWMKRMDHSEGDKEVMVPIISWPNKEKQTAFVKELRKEFKKFMKEWEKPDWFDAALERELEKKRLGREKLKVESEEANTVSADDQE